ncbi:MAG TPA: PEP/pyruvate-binding domain-containing protein, partial [Blastocatellia bacterium]|nr:PEP/pyruvate-binding domain-containing protein [Blastocatellia bacterium]
MKYILFPTDSSPDLGGKATALASLQAANVTIPKWFVVSPAAFWASLSPEQTEALTLATSAEEIEAALQDLACESEVAGAIQTALQTILLNKDGVAVRSSAMDEDGAAHSFAGQLESFLHVAAQDVPAKVAAVWQSGFSARLLAYRQGHSLSLQPAPPAVLIQQMVNAECAGVAFAADPLSGQRSVAVISAVRGLGSALVAGECNADIYRVNRAGEIIDRQMVAAAPILHDHQIKQIATLVRTTTQHFKRPQDIEWAMEDGQLYLLQSRPITTIADVADPDGGLNLWDNSNIAESYGGVTTPLTFSFARRAYEEVYRQFCRLMLVPEATIQKHDQTFKHMLGLLQGRVYYNLLNWYRVLAMLPGFKLNRRFMEQMMGVKEALPESLLAEIGTASRGEKLRDALSLLRTISGLVSNHFLLAKKIDAFYARLNQALQATNPALEAMRSDELAAYYRRIEAQLLTRWDAPLINDFFAMIFYGMLRRLCEQWCGDVNSSLQNALLSGNGGIISAEPAKRIRAMAESIQNDEELIALLNTGTLDAINARISTIPHLQAQISNYLGEFGDRCLDELKLESPTLHDDPLLLFRAIGQAARNALGAPAACGQSSQPQIHRKETRTAHNPPDMRIPSLYPGSLKSHPLRKLVFDWVLRNARDRVRERENLRFERTRLFGRARRLFLEIGSRFYADNQLDEARDIFYLEVEEVLGFIEGATTTTDLRGLVAVRKAEFAHHRKAQAPADRLATHGTVHQGNQYRPITTDSVTTLGDSRKGLGCSPGIVRGKVRVISDPRNAVLQPGEILVAERTDPGWVLLFASAAGLLVERGSLLSHAAIVSREMRLPAIVSLPGVTQWLKDGDEVEFDGSTGVVQKKAAQVHEPAH